MTYVVIENTPGYLPEDDQPFVTNDYAAAVAYANELADQYEQDDDAEFPWTADRSWASSGNYYAISVSSERPYELGRWIAVETLEEDLTEDAIEELYV